MVDKNLLRGRIVANGYTQGQLAERMNLSVNTISAKINGKRAFTLPEVEEMCAILGIEDPEEKCEIFLPKLSPNGDTTSTEGVT